MSDPNSLYQRARAAAGLNRVGDYTDEFIGQQAEDSPLSEEQYLKMRYKFVLGRLDTNPDDRQIWEDRRDNLEEQLMDHDIRPSTLIG